MITGIAATKANLLGNKKTLALAREGYGLLDEKRAILMNELVSVVHVMDRLQRDTDAALLEGYGILEKAVVVVGRRSLESLSFSVDIKTDLSLSRRRVMGVSIPVIQAQIKDNPPYFSDGRASFYVDETIAKFRQALGLLVDLSQRKIELLRLAKELQKTIRKVNALEKVYIPFYKDVVKTIGDRLDEESRESFLMLKLIKEKLDEQE
jgi:V/A-type H+/Na+-transporting ATPase subunit D